MVVTSRKPHYEFLEIPNLPHLAKPCTGINLEQYNFKGNSIRKI